MPAGGGVAAGGDPAGGGVTAGEPTGGRGVEVTWTAGVGVAGPAGVAVAWTEIAVPVALAAGEPVGLGVPTTTGVPVPAVRVTTGLGLTVPTVPVAVADCSGIAVGNGGSVGIVICVGVGGSVAVGVGVSPGWEVRVAVAPGMVMAAGGALTLLDRVTAVAMPATHPAVAARNSRLTTAYQARRFQLNPRSQRHPLLNVSPVAQVPQLARTGRCYAAGQQPRRTPRHPGQNRRAAAPIARSRPRPPSPR